ncbi:MFS transporter [Duganella sp. CF517]|uniref:MFS transporter n=1 Tax=Duganella sp. CF517 TaxID=1881038 RepID=UPI0011609F96
MITDFAEFRQGERRQTATFANILVIFKAGGAASLAMVGWTSERLGYVPGVAQSESVIQGMKLFAYGVPGPRLAGGDPDVAAPRDRA